MKVRVIGAIMWDRMGTTTGTPLPALNGFEV